MPYSNYQFEQNRRTSQTLNQGIRLFFMFAEDAIKFVVNFIGEMYRMVVGK